MAGLEPGDRMSTVISPLPEDLFAALVSYAKGLLGTTVEVIRAFDNDVSMPNSDHVRIQSVSSQALSTNVDTYDKLAGTRTVKTPKRVGLQIECFGENAWRWVEILQNLWRDDYAVQTLAPVCTPLYASTARYLPVQTAEARYVPRYLFEAYCEYDPTVTVTQEFAEALNVDLVEVDATYPP